MSTKRNRATMSPADNTELFRMAVALLACLVRGVKESADQILVMDAFDVSSPLIARSLGISPISVRTALHRRRKTTKGR